MFQLIVYVTYEHIGNTSVE